MNHPFTRLVTKAMQEIAPVEYADQSWDNVGLLVDNLNSPTTPHQTDAPPPPCVLLTNDLTADVVDEAIKNKVTVIVTYHPFIFRGLKAVTTNDTQQTSLLRLVQHNIAVYSPHTALDATPGGINDWLADKVAHAAVAAGAGAFQTTVLRPAAGAPASAAASVGYGRKIMFRKPVQAESLVAALLDDFCYKDPDAPTSSSNNNNDDDAPARRRIEHVLVAPPRFPPAGDTGRSVVQSVAVCAGSGIDVLRSSVTAAPSLSDSTVTLTDGTSVTPFDTQLPTLLLTGEASHHDALWASARNVWVVCTLHSNSERLYLAERLRGRLERRLIELWHSLDDQSSDPRLRQKPRVFVSRCDRDPFVIWSRQDLAAQRAAAGQGVSLSSI